MTGNYTVTAERVSGNCDPSLDPKDPVSFSIATEDGKPIAKLPGLPGGCPLELNRSTCKATGQCEISDKDGAVIGTVAIDWTFSATGYTGTSASGLRPPAVTSTCQVTYRETGKRL